MSNASYVIPQPDIEAIRYAIPIARKNWTNWQTVFEHSGEVGTNPLLTNPEKFKAFVREYSVGRTIRKCKADNFRCQLRDSPEFMEAIADDTARLLRELEQRWRENFGTRKEKDPTKPANAIISALSKISAFVRPERFLAWDGYAKRGLNVASGAPISYDFGGAYDKYLAEVDKIWNGLLGEKICALTSESTEHPVERQVRFQRRVLDVYLMQLGGRDI